MFTYMAASNTPKHSSLQLLNFKSQSGRINYLLLLTSHQDFLVFRNLDKKGSIIIYSCIQQ